MKGLFMSLYQWSFVVLIVTLWILLFVQDIPAGWGTSQWVVMMMLTGMSAFAFSIIQSSIKNDEKKQ